MFLKRIAVTICSGSSNRQVPAQRVYYVYCIIIWRGVFVSQNGGHLEIRIEQVYNIPVIRGFDEHFTILFIAVIENHITRGRKHQARKTIGRHFYIPYYNGLCAVYHYYCTSLCFFFFFAYMKYGDVIDIVVGVFFRFTLYIIIICTKYTATRTVCAHIIYDNG